MQTLTNPNSTEKIPTLFPYQIDGANWLSTKRHALLADEMGLGKSAQAIRACNLMKAETVVVICPAAVKENWLREWQMFGDSTIKTTVHIFSYNKAEMALALGKYDVLILDESHYLKSPKTKRTKAIYGKQGIIRQAQRTFCLSGTPAPNNPSELWTMLFTFGITPLKFDEFTERFCNYFENVYGRQITGAKQERIPELRQMLSGVMLRRQKEDVMKELPEIFYQNIVVQPGPPPDLELEDSFIQYVFPVDRREELELKLKHQETLLEQMMGINSPYSKDGMKSLEAMANSVSTLRRYTGLRKLQGVGDIIEQELLSNAYQKIVVFAIHRCVINGLMIRLRQFKPVSLYGGTPAEKRQRNIDKFQNNPRCRVFIGNIQSAGTGITLTAAHNVIFAEQDWVPGNNAQAAMRCHRIGQTKPVMVRFVGLANSIDEQISRVLKRKTTELTAIFDRERLPVFESAATDFKGDLNTTTIPITENLNEEDIFS